MSLEAEAMKQRGFRPESAPRPVKPGAIIARVVAAVLLLALLSVSYWVPLNYTGPLGAAIVLAALTLLAANLASQVHSLRQRVDAMEEELVAGSESAAAPDQK